MSSSAEVNGTGTVRRTVYVIGPYISARASDSTSPTKPSSGRLQAAPEHFVGCLSVLAFKFFGFMLDNRIHRHEYLVACRTSAVSLLWRGA